MNRKPVMKAYQLLIFILLLVLPLLLGASPRPTDKFYVNDYAEVLPQQLQETIFDYSKELYDKTDAQVVVLTVTTLDGKNVEEYALETARAWGIGSSDKNNGVLILLSTGDREARVEVGYGLEGCINDAKAGRLIDEFAIPYYKDNDFAQGTEKLYYAILNLVRQEYGLEVLPDTPRLSQAEETPFSWEVAVGLAILFVIGLLCVWLLLILWRGGVYIFLLLVDQDTAKSYLPIFFATLNPLKCIILFFADNESNNVSQRSKGRQSSKSSGGSRGGGGGFGGGGASRKF